MKNGGPDAEQLRRLADSLRKAGGTALGTGLSLAGRSRVGRAALAAMHEVAGQRPEPRTITVWDGPTRIFKWLLVAFVGIAFLASSMHPRGLLFVVHAACGYAVALLLLFRLAWGVIGGSAHASRTSCAAGAASARTPRRCSGSITRRPPGTIRSADG